MNVTSFVRVGLAVIAAVPATSVAAQEATVTVFPTSAATTMGAFHAMPFSVEEGRTQSLMMATGFAGGVGSTITAVTFRAPLEQTTFAGKIVELEVRMGPAAVTPYTMSATFAKNWGGPATVVLPRGFVSLPNLTSPSGGITPFVVRLPFTTGYVLSGDLLQEIQVYSASMPSRYDVDSAFVARPQGTVMPFGQACVGSAGIPIHVYPDPRDLLPGATFGENVRQAAPGSAAIDVLGTSTSAWGGVPLPFTWPGTSCSIDTDALVWQIAAVDALGRVGVGWHVPFDRGLEGLTLNSQWAILDGRQGAPLLVTTDAAQLTLGVYPPVDFETVWTIGPELSGTRDPDTYRGLVEQLELR